MSNLYDPPQGCSPRKIVCAANKYGDLIIPSARHHDKCMNNVIQELGGRGKLLERINYANLDEFRKEQGFIDQYGDYWDRQQAMDIVKLNNQKIQRADITHGMTKLYSENLY